MDIGKWAGSRHKSAQLRMIKISITGPESSGKSALCEWLSIRIKNSIAIPEVARIYLEAKKNGYKYVPEDLINITIQSENAIEDAIKKNKAVVINDSDFYIMRIWWEEVYKTKNEFIRTRSSDINFDVYILCEPDLPWEYDPLRENEHDRYRLYEIYKRTLSEDNRKVIYANGQDDLRFENVLTELKKLFPQLNIKNSTQKRS